MDKSSCSQYTIGIEDKTTEEILQMLPRAIPRRQRLAKLGSGDLVVLRNIYLVTQDAYQSQQDARSSSAGLARLEDEIRRRGLDHWLADGCPRCRVLFTVQVLRDGDLAGFCACTTMLNTEEIK